VSVYRKDPAASHAYTVPVVRETLTHAGASSGSSGVSEVPQPVVYAADAHAW
jgi:hypothetical protein